MPLRCLKQVVTPIAQVLQCRALKYNVFSSPKTPCWHKVQILGLKLGTQSQYPLPLSSLWQPILKRSKRCMQRKERGKSRSDLAWRSAGAAKQCLYVQRRES